MSKIKQYLNEKIEELGEKMKKPAFWLEQIVDIVVVSLFFLSFIGKLPWKYAIWAIIAYFGATIMLVIYRALKKALEETQTTHNGRRKRK